jgi:aminopeptidase N
MLARITLCAFLTATLCAPFVSSSASIQDPIFERIKLDHEQIEKAANRRGVATASFDISSVEPQSIDVQHYKLQLQLTPNEVGTAGAVSGSVTISGRVVASVSSISIDAQPNLTIDSVTLNGSPNNFRRTNARIIISLPPTANPGSAFTIVIQYHAPGSGSSPIGGGLLFTRHGPDSVPVMATHSEPFGAPLWWPCVDNPADKATAEIEVTVPRGNEVASNGVLDKVQMNADHTVTYFWREDSPLSTYLVSVAATNFERFEDSYTALDGVTKMPLVYYVYPEHLDLARAKFGVVRSAIEIYSGLFGEYPFLREKYGMAEFPFGGAMEHQTITSISSSIVGSVTSNNQATIVHELAHHWWGDLVTMKTWDDIWLNEGFATYCEVLFFERFAGVDPGELLARSYDDGAVDGALKGTVIAENPDNPFDDQGAIYRKGGWVLHMLRHVMGDQKFFNALKQYAIHYGFSNASTRDFEQVCEEFYGSSLDWFFEQWIYTPGRPIYKVSADIGPPVPKLDYSITLVVKQRQTQEIPGRGNATYIMPLDVTIHYIDGSSDTRVVFNDKQKQTFTFDVVKRPISVGVDESHWVLKKLKQQ